MSHYEMKLFYKKRKIKKDQNFIFLEVRTFNFMSHLNLVRHLNP